MISDHSLTVHIKCEIPAVPAREEVLARLLAVPHTVPDGVTVSALDLNPLKFDALLLAATRAMAHF